MDIDFKQLKRLMPSGHIYLLNCPKWITVLGHHDLSPSLGPIESSHRASVK